MAPSHLVGDTTLTTSIAEPIPSGAARTRPLKTSLTAAVRQLGVCVTAGIASGMVVGGLGGRLSMFVLAVLNPTVRGIRSDDGFPIGEFTVAGSLNLLLVGAALGAFGGAVYWVLRPVLIGPRWFQVASLSLGPAVVVGSMLVHTNGVDFLILRPRWLPIAMFVAIPGLYAAVLTLAAETWLRHDSTGSRLPLGLLAAPVVALFAFPPLAFLMIAGWFAIYGARRTRAGAAFLDHQVAPWIVRAGLTVVWIAAVAALIRDIDTLT